MSSTYYDLENATSALLDKLDVVEKAISGIFVLAHVHNMPYTGPNYKEEYDLCRTLTGTKRKETLDDPPPRNPALEWFLNEKNRDHLKKWSGKYVAVIRTRDGVTGVVEVNEDLNDLLTEFYKEFGDHEPVYFGYVHPETITTTASTIDLMGDTCPRCSQGTFQESNIHDNFDGVLYCTNCNYEVKRWDND